MSDLFGSSDIMGFGVDFSVNDNNAVDRLYGIELAIKSLCGAMTDTLPQAADSTTAALDTLFDSARALTKTGTQLESLGTKISWPINYLKNQVMSVGSEYQMARRQLTAFYGDVDKAEEVIQRSLRYAAETVYDPRSVRELVIGLKRVGAEAFTEFEDANGEVKIFLDYMADLAALKPSGTPFWRFTRSVQEAFSGNWLSIQRILNLPAAEIKKIANQYEKTGEGYMQALVALAKKFAPGLSSAMFGTVEQMMASMQERIEMFVLAISDAGAFDTVKQTLYSMSMWLASIDAGQIQRLGKAISDALGIVLKPAIILAQWGMKLGDIFLNIVDKHPKLATAILVIAGVLGSILIVGGKVLKMFGSLGFALVGIEGFKKAIAGLGGLKTALLGLVPSMSSLAALLPVIAPYLALLAGLTVAWGIDLFGVRTQVTSFIAAWKNTRSIVNDTENLEKNWKNLNKALSESPNLTTRWTASLMKVFAPLRGISEGLTYYYGEGNKQFFQMDEQLYNVLKDMGMLDEVFGVWSSITTITDAWTASFDNVKEAIGGVIDALGALFGLSPNVAEFGTMWDIIGAAAHEVAMIIQRVADNLVFLLYPINAVTKGIRLLAAETKYAFAWLTGNKTMKAEAATEIDSIKQSMGDDFNKLTDVMSSMIPGLNFSGHSSYTTAEEADYKYHHGQANVNATSPTSVMYDKDMSYLANLKAGFANISPSIRSGDETIPNYIYVPPSLGGNLDKIPASGWGGKTEVMNVNGVTINVTAPNAEAAAKAVENALTMQQLKNKSVGVVVNPTSGRPLATLGGLPSPFLNPSYGLGK